MSKYIDADKLIAKIKELNLATKTYDEQVAFNNALAMVVEIITSLQQEQPKVDLEKEYEQYVTNDPVYSKLVNRIAGLSIANHFCELGLRRAAEMYDEIEYNRQRAEEESE